MDKVDLERLSGGDMVAHVRNISDMTQLAGIIRHLLRFGKDHNCVKKTFSKNYLIGQPFLYDTTSTSCTSRRISLTMCSTPL